MRRLGRNRLDDFFLPPGKTHQLQYPPTGDQRARHDQHPYLVEIDDDPAYIASVQH